MPTSNERNFKPLFYSIVLILNIFIPVFATPHQIIIIRHADKLIAENESPTLSARGFIRSVVFAFYYQNKFDTPDYFFAKNPVNEDGKGIAFRELQTLGPLVNIYAKKFPNKESRVNRSFRGEQYKELAADLLNRKIYNGKRIIICWNRINIPLLAKSLGVTQDLDPWDEDNYDSVYVINYHTRGPVSSFEILDHQYPVKANANWENIYASLAYL